MSDSGNYIEDFEGHDIRRNTLSGDWAQVKSLIDYIAQREGFPSSLILLEARDSTGSNVLHYAVQKNNSGKYFPTPGRLSSCAAMTVFCSRIVLSRANS